jgi:hypothetical protein
MQEKITFFLILFNFSFYAMIQLVKVLAAYRFIIAVPKGQLLARPHNLALCVKSQMMRGQFHTAVNLATGFVQVHFRPNFDKAA